MPQPFAPLYSAAKAALHHYGLVLRAALADTAVAGIDAGRSVVSYGPTAGPEITGQVAPQQALFDTVAARSAVPGYVRAA